MLDQSPLTCRCPVSSHTSSAQAAQNLLKQCPILAMTSHTTSARAAQNSFTQSPILAISSHAISWQGHARVRCCCWHRRPCCRF